MKKKKILTLATALAVASILVAGGSLAYFTAEDEADNVFTVGDVNIELQETFEQDSKLIPGTEDMNVVEKVVHVKNTGSEEAYVRVHIAIPSELDASGVKYVHLIPGTPEEGKENPWSWAASETLSAYTTEIGNRNYNVYVVTYADSLDPSGTDAAIDKTQVPAITGVYMDSTVTNEIINTLKEAGVIEDGKLQIRVMAEGVQKTGFDSASEAFGAALVYSADSNPFNDYGAGE